MLENITTEICSGHTFPRETHITVTLVYIKAKCKDSRTINESPTDREGSSFHFAFCFDTASMKSIQATSQSTRKSKADF